MGNNLSVPVGVQVISNHPSDCITGCRSSYRLQVIFQSTLPTSKSVLATGPNSCCNCWCLPSDQGMKHRLAFRRLGRDSAHRWSMLRTLVTQLLEHQRIETTLARAKELRRLADHVITISKEGGINARRKAAAIVNTDTAIHNLFSVYAHRYKERDGGYTRVLRSRRRPNDSAQMAFIEYVDREGELRPSRPPRRHGQFLPPAAQAALQQSQ